MFYLLYLLVVEALAYVSMARAFNRESSSDVSILLAAITKFDFIVSITTVSEVLGFMKQLSTVLQGRQEDIISGFQHAHKLCTHIIETGEFIICRPVDYICFA